MRRYASMLAVTGGLAVAVAGCAGEERDAACGGACSAFEEVTACEGCGPCESCGACGACESCGACEACGACGACGACEASDPEFEVRNGITVRSEETRTPLDIPAYPNWPPEEASSRIDIGDRIPDGTGLSLYAVGQKLRDALDLADYSEHSFYSVPGGFILVTQREQIDPEGRTMPGAARFQQPGEGRDASMLTQMRDLFLERPPSYYRFLALVITDRPFGASEGSLSAERATDIVQQGSTALSRDARDILFTEDFFAIALIYEYENTGVGTALTMIEPGRIRPAEHLERSGLAEALPRAFEQPGARR